MKRREAYARVTRVTVVARLGEVQPSKRRFALLAVVLLAPLLPAPAAASAVLDPTVAPASFSLPGVRWGAAAAWTGELVLLAGGRACPAECVASASVLAIDPATGVVSESADALPWALHGAGAAWTGTRLLLFGGASSSSAVLAFDPATGLAERTDLELPETRRGVSVAWTGDVALVFGGLGASATDAIVRVDTVSGDVTVAAARLPSPRAWTAAAWDGRFAYVVGGEEASRAPTDEILRYDPEADEVTVLEARLPGARSHAAAAWDGHRLVIVGGKGEAGNDVVLVDPVTSAVSAFGSELPVAAYGASALWAAGRTLLLGGCCEAPLAHELTVASVPPPTPEAALAPPTGAVAAQGPHDPRVRVAWTPAAEHPALGVAYRVFARASPDAPRELRGTVSGASAFEDDAPPFGSGVVYDVVAFDGARESAPAAAPAIAIAPAFVARVLPDRAVRGLPADVAVTLTALAPGDVALALGGGSECAASATARISRAFERKTVLLRDACTFTADADRGSIVVRSSGGSLPFTERVLSVQVSRPEPWAFPELGARVTLPLDEEPGAAIPTAARRFDARALDEAPFDVGAENWRVTAVSGAGEGPLDGATVERAIASLGADGAYRPGPLARLVVNASAPAALPGTVRVYRGPSDVASTTPEAGRPAVLYRGVQNPLFLDDGARWTWSCVEAVCGFDLDAHESCESPIPFSTGAAVTSAGGAETSRLSQRFPSPVFESVESSLPLTLRFDVRGCTWGPPGALPAVSVEAEVNGAPVAIPGGCRIEGEAATCASVAASFPRSLLGASGATNLSLLFAAEQAASPAPLSGYFVAVTRAWIEPPAQSPPATLADAPALVLADVAPAALPPDLDASVRVRGASPVHARARACGSACASADERPDPLAFEILVPVAAGNATAPPTSTLTALAAVPDAGTLAGEATLARAPHAFSLAIEPQRGDAADGVRTTLLAWLSNDGPAWLPALAPLDPSASVAVAFARDDGAPSPDPVRVAPLAPGDRVAIELPWTPRAGVVGWTASAVVDGASASASATFRARPALAARLASPPELSFAESTEALVRFRLGIHPSAFLDAGETPRLPADARVDVGATLRADGPRGDVCATGRASAGRAHLEGGLAPLVVAWDAPPGAACAPLAPDASRPLHLALRFTPVGYADERGASFEEAFEAAMEPTAALTATFPALADVDGVAFVARVAGHRALNVSATARVCVGALDECASAAGAEATCDAAPLVAEARPLACRWTAPSRAPGAPARVEIELRGAPSDGSGPRTVRATLPLRDAPRGSVDATSLAFVRAGCATDAGACAIAAIRERSGSGFGFVARACASEAPASSAAPLRASVVVEQARRVLARVPVSFSWTGSDACSTAHAAATSLAGFSWSGGEIVARLDLDATWPVARVDVASVESRLLVGPEGAVELLDATEGASWRPESPVAPGTTMEITLRLRGTGGARVPDVAIDLVGQPLTALGTPTGVAWPLVSTRAAAALGDFAVPVRFPALDVGEAIAVSARVRYVRPDGVEVVGSFVPVGPVLRLDHASALRVLVTPPAAPLRYGETGEATVRVRNVGNAPSPPATVALHAALPGTGEAAVLATGAVPSLPPGGESGLALRFAPRHPAYALVAVVEATGGARLGWAMTSPIGTLTPFALDDVAPVRVDAGSVTFDARLRVLSAVPDAAEIDFSSSALPDFRGSATVGAFAFGNATLRFGPVADEDLPWAGCDAPLVLPFRATFRSFDLGVANATVRPASEIDVRFPARESVLAPGEPWRLPVSFSVPPDSFASVSRVTARLTTRALVDGEPAPNVTILSRPASALGPGCGGAPVVDLFPELELLTVLGEGAQVETRVEARAELPDGSNVTFSREGPLLVVVPVADLAVRALDPWPAATAGRVAALRFGVENVGTATSVESRIVRLHPDGRSVNVTPLAVGESRAYAFEWIAEPGLHVFSLEATDRSGKRDATSENNFASIPVLVPESLAFEDESAHPGYVNRARVALRFLAPGATGVELRVDDPDGAWEEVPFAADGRYHVTLDGEGEHVVEARAYADTPFGLARSGALARRVLLDSTPPGVLVGEPTIEWNGTLADYRARWTVETSNATGDPVLACAFAGASLEALPRGGAYALTLDGPRPGDRVPCSLVVSDAAGNEAPDPLESLRLPARFDVLPRLARLDVAHDFADHSVRLSWDLPQNLGGNEVRGFVVRWAGPSEGCLVLGPEARDARVGLPWAIGEIARPIPFHASVALAGEGASCLDAATTLSVATATDLTVNPQVIAFVEGALLAACLAAAVAAAFGVHRARWQDRRARVRRRASTLRARAWETSRSIASRSPLARSWRERRAR